MPVRGDIVAFGGLVAVLAAAYIEGIIGALAGFGVLVVTLLIARLLERRPPRCNACRLPLHEHEGAFACPQCDRRYGERLDTDPRAYERRKTIVELLREHDRERRALGRNDGSDA